MTTIQHHYAVYRCGFRSTRISGVPEPRGNDEICACEMLAASREERAATDKSRNSPTVNVNRCILLLLYNWVPQVFFYNIIVLSLWPAHDVVVSSREYSRNGKQAHFILCSSRRENEDQ